MNPFERLSTLEDADIGYTEEDVKINIIVPLLEALGHHRLRYEHAKHDIIISSKDWHVGPIIVETKKLKTNLSNYLSQLERYSSERRAFIAILTNGEKFLVFSPFWRRKEFKDTLVLAFKRQDLNEPPLASLLNDLLSSQSLSMRIAERNLEVRERKITEQQQTIYERENEHKEKIVDLKDKITNTKKHLESLENELNSLKEELTQIGREGLSQIYAYHDYGIRHKVSGMPSKDIFKTSKKGSKLLRHILMVCHEVYVNQLNYTEAVRKVANNEKVTYQTIADGCTRRLKITTNQFKELLSNRNKIKLFLHKRFPNDSTTIDQNIS